MYSAQVTKKRIMDLCKNQSAEQMLKDCDLGVNAIRQINDTKGIASFSLAKIADYLNVSVDYLLGRTDNPQAHKPNSSVSISDVSGNSNSFIGNGAAGNVTVNAPSLDDDQNELIGLYSRLSPLQKAKVMVLISDIADGKSDL